MDDLESIASGFEASQGLRLLRAGLFDEQQAFMRDPAKRKTGRCGRRAGKTRICVTGGAEAGETGNVLYVLETRLLAKRQFWVPLKKFNDQFKLGIHFNDSELVADTPGGGFIMASGLDDRRQLDKKRGFPWHRVIIDEAGTAKIDLKEFVVEVVEPGLMDYDGDLWLMGTPNASCQGFFHDADTGLQGWSGHHWTCLQNPYINGRKYIDTMVATYGLSYEDPYVQREYFGEWVPGGGRLVYKFQNPRNVYQALPEGIEWRHVIGTDVGWVDSTAFAVLAYSPRHPVAYEVFAAKRPQMVVSEVEGMLRELMKRYPNAQVVMDPGGGGKLVAADIMSRTSLPIIPALKTEKISTQGLLNSDLVGAKVKVLSTSPTINEWLSLQQMPDGKEDPTVHNDLADAFLYAYRYCRQWIYREPVKEDLSINSPSWADRMEQKKLKELEARKKAERRWRRYG